MIGKHELSQALSDELLPAGFRRKGSNWTKAGEDVVAVINLQKSNYDESYFLNLGFWLVELGENAEPKEEQCHVRTRADAVASSGSHSIGDLLTQGRTDLTKADHLARIREFTKTQLVPLVQEGLSKAGLKKFIGRHDDLLVRQVAREILEASNSE